MKRISVFLSMPQYQALKALARQRGLRFAEVLRQAIDFFLHASR